MAGLHNHGVDRHRQGLVGDRAPFEHAFVISATRPKQQQQYSHSTESVTVALMGLLALMASCRASHV